MEVERIANAVYRDTEEDLAPLRDNPLIAALPELKDSKDILIDLSSTPEYHNSDRQKPVPKRRLACEQVAHFYQPNRHSLQIAMQLDSCLRWGYVNRNPLLPSTVQQYNRMFDHAGPTLPKAFNIPNTYGFSIIGISGIGKTVTLNNVLNNYHQVIRHTEYMSMPLHLDQVVWLKIDCAPDGSLKGTCRNFMLELDHALGTDYHERYRSERLSVDQLFNAVRQLAQTYSLGVLVIDELHNLCNTKERVSDITLNFFVSLVNTIGVPVICCGTGKAKKLFMSSFQQARRGSGKGEVIMSRMNPDKEWERFMSSMWRLQFTRLEVPLTPSMVAAFHTESLGIPYIAAHLYDLVQEEAILSGRETFSETDIHRVATEKMLLTNHVREKLKSGMDVDLEADLDVSPYTYYPTDSEIDVSTDDVQPQDKPDEKKSSVTESVTEALANALGIDSSKARKYVLKASASHDAPVSFPCLFQQAYAMWQNSAADPTPTIADPLADMESYEDFRASGLTGADTGNDSGDTL